MQYAGVKDVEGLGYEEEKYQRLQETLSGISLSFANVKEKTYAATVRKINQLLLNLYS